MTPSGDPAVTAEMAYIGIAPCDCVFMATVISDRPNRKEHIAEAVAEVLRDGGTVERVPVEEARERLQFDCPHDPKWGGMP